MIGKWVRRTIGGESGITKDPPPRPTAALQGEQEGFTANGAPSSRFAENRIVFAGNRVYEHP